MRAVHFNFELCFLAENNYRALLCDSNPLGVGKVYYMLCAAGKLRAASAILCHKPGGVQECPPPTAVKLTRVCICIFVLFMET